MSARRLRAAVDAAQRDWDRTVSRVAARWSRELAALDDPGEVHARLRRMLTSQTDVAARHGVAAARTVIAAAGAEKGEIPAVDAAPPKELARTLRRAWRATGQLPEPSTARRAVLARIIDQALSDAWREGIHEALVASPSVIGWRRVSRPGCCGACLAAANGRIHPLTEQLAEHPHGRCIAEPVIAGVNDRSWGRLTGRQRWERMTATEQDAMFYGRGGRRKADLIRSGDSQLEDLIAWAPRHPDQRQRPREATLTELQLDAHERAALAHRTGVEFGDEAPDAPRPLDPDELDDAFADLIAWLRQDPQHQHLLAWQATDRTYEQVQAALRHGVTPSAEISAVIDTLNEALTRGVLPHRVRLYRGVRDLRRVFGTDDPEKLLGNHVLDGFVATSLTREVAIDEFTRPGARRALLELDVPEATPAVWVSGAGDRRLSYQGEVLLASETRIRVVAVRREGDLPVLSCEVVS